MTQNFRHQLKFKVLPLLLDFVETRIELQPEVLIVLFIADFPADCCQVYDVCML